MQMKIGVLLAVIVVALTGCFDSENKTTETTLSPTPVPESSYDFKLSAIEQEVYNSFQKDLNEQHLKDLEPISIAKLFIQAKLDDNYDVVYALYTDTDSHVQWTKEEDEKILDSDRGTNEKTLIRYNNIETGKFIQTSDFEGHIEYWSDKDAEKIAENMSGFNMIKDEDGIWNVSFMPIQ